MLSRSRALPLLLVNLLAPIHVLSLAKFKPLKWCEYWAERGVFQPECKPQASPHWSFTTTTTPSPWSTPRIQALPRCKAIQYLSRCTRTAHCSFGLLCFEGREACCAPALPSLSSSSTSSSSSASASCPAPSTLGYQCNSIKKNVNWCERDSHCAVSGHSMSRCCPTPCGYNICVLVQPPINFPRRIEALLEQPEGCPSSFDVGINCVSSRGVSWCSSDEHCRGKNRAQERRCCGTHCGYSVCLLKEKTRWLIA